MGFLDRFRGTRPDIVITVDPAEALPGDEIRVRVAVEGELDDRTESGRAGIRCLNDFLKREWDRQDDEWEEVWRAITLHNDAQDLPLQPGEHEYTFRIPEGLPPDSAKAVSWWAWAQIERRRGLDANASTRIAVRLPASSAPQGRRPVPPGEDGVGFEDLPESAAAGGTLDGVVSVTPREDVKATGVNVRLERRCTYTADNHRIERGQEVAEVEVAGAQELAAGQTQQFSFSIPLPENPGPTAVAPHTVVEWTVTGVVARRMRPDLTLRVPIVVYDGR